jgi:hypothetical protein
MDRMKMNEWLDLPVGIHVESLTSHYAPVIMDEVLLVTYLELQSHFVSAARSIVKMIQAENAVLVVDMFVSDAVDIEPTVDELLGVQLTGRSLFGRGLDHRMLHVRKSQHFEEYEEPLF